MREEDGRRRRDNPERREHTAHRPVGPRHWRDPREECQACERSHNRVRHDERPLVANGAAAGACCQLYPRPQETPDVTILTASLSTIVLCAA